MLAIADFEILPNLLQRLRIGRSHTRNRLLNRRSGENFLNVRVRLDKGIHIAKLAVHVLHQSGQRRVQRFANRRAANLNALAGDIELSPNDRVLQQTGRGFFPLLRFCLLRLNDFANGFGQLRNVALLDVFFDPAHFLEFLIIIPTRAEQHNRFVICAGLKNQLRVRVALLQTRSQRDQPQPDIAGGLTDDGAVHHRIKCKIVSVPVAEFSSGIEIGEHRLTDHVNDVV